MPKKGFLSPSNFAKIMTKGRKKDVVFGKTALAYADEIVLGLLGVDMPLVISKHLEHGLEYEEFAIERYEKDTMNSVSSVGNSIIHQDSKFHFICGIPDGLIGLDGIIEVKCPSNPINHLNNLLYCSQYEQYKYQIQGYLWITGRKWCDFVSYLPEQDLDYRLRLSVHRIDRDEAIIAELEKRCLLFWDVVQEKYNEVISKLNTHETI